MLLYVFYLLSAITVGCALATIFSKNPVYSVLFVIATFFSIAGHFILLNAQFLAVVQVIVYAGAIMVLFLTVLMYLNLNKTIEASKPLLIKIAAMVSGGLLFLVLLASLKSGFSISAPVNHEAGLIKNLGKTLFSEYLFPFEATAVLFLSTMAGAITLTKKNS
jgi:NADH-quinone oxidoreductase subunit J